MRKNLIIFIMGCFLLISFEGNLRKEDEKIHRLNYQGKEGLSQMTLISKMIGVKKAAASLLWVRQVIVVGENLGIEDVDKAVSEIYKGSEGISYLDPYFIGNYQFSGSILAFIRTYRKYEMAFDIFTRGIDYNPESEVLKKYLAGTLASSKGNIAEILLIFEEIVEESRDDLLINTLAFTYEQIYEETKEERYRRKMLHYLEQLLNSKEKRYKERALEKLEKYSK